MKNSAIDFVCSLLESKLGSKKKNTTAQNATTIVLGLAAVAGISYIVSVLTQPASEESKETNNADGESDEQPRPRKARGNQSKIVHADESGLN